MGNFAENLNLGNRVRPPLHLLGGGSTDLNTWIAGSHGFACSSMRATGNPSAAILLQSKHWIDTLTYAHVSAWNATGDRFLASNFMKILKKKMEKLPRSSRLLNIYWKLLKKLLMLINLKFVQY